MHYVVAINNSIPASSDIITVIPLTSKKDTYKPSPYTIDLGDTIYSQLKTKYDMSILLVSHDLDLVKKYADRVILLDKQVVKEGTPEEVFESLEFKSYFGEI